MMLRLLIMTWYIPLLVVLGITVSGCASDESMLREGQTVYRTSAVCPKPSTETDSVYIYDQLDQVKVAALLACQKGNLRRIIITQGSVGYTVFIVKVMYE